MYDYTSVNYCHRFKLLFTSGPTYIFLFNLGITMTDTFVILYTGRSYEFLNFMVTRKKLNAEKMIL